MNESIDKLIDESLSLMVSEVVEQAENLKLSSPLARLKFWYYDTSAPKCYFSGSAITEADRVRILRDDGINACLLYTSPSPRDGLLSRMPSSA